MSYFKDDKGEWHPYPANYDIMDEVRAFNAQLRVAPPIKDTPLLSRLRTAKDDNERARILLNVYPHLNPKKVAENIVFTVGASYGTGYKVGDVIRDGKIFGRVAVVNK